MSISDRAVKIDNIWVAVHHVQIVTEESESVEHPVANIHFGRGDRITVRGMSAAEIAERLWGDRHVDR